MKKCHKCKKLKDKKEFSYYRKKENGLKLFCKVCDAEYRRKENARREMRKAVNDGKLNRPSECSECNTSCKPEGHHIDYSRPLDVLWLCRGCHRKLHTELGKEVA